METVGTKYKTLKIAAGVALAMLGLFVLINGGSVVVALVFLGVGVVAFATALSGG